MINKSQIYHLSPLLFFSKYKADLIQEIFCS